MKRLLYTLAATCILCPSAANTDASESPQTAPPPTIRDFRKVNRE